MVNIFVIDDSKEYTDSDSDCDYDYFEEIDLFMNDNDRSENYNTDRKQVICLVKEYLEHYDAHDYSHKKLSNILYKIAKISNVDILDVAGDMEYAQDCGYYNKPSYERVNAVFDLLEKEGFMKHDFIKEDDVFDYLQDIYIHKYFLSKKEYKKYMNKTLKYIYDEYTLWDGFNRPSRIIQMKVKEILLD